MSFNPVNVNLMKHENKTKSSRQQGNKVLFADQNAPTASEEKKKKELQL